MSRKRRTFDIDAPLDEAPVATAPGPRRGPMASAIAENAEALQARKSAADAIRAENDALAHEYVARRAAGHVVEALALDDIHTARLVRDRLPGEDEELDSLMISIRDVGLSNPIRVVPRGDGAGGYELVQGYRRLSAYRRLLDDTGEAAWATIPALVLEPEEGNDALYRRMVDENVIRKDLSFAEMAYAAQNYAADPATEAGDLSEAIAALFQSAPYSKRSYIKSFALVLDRLGQVLNFPTEIPRALGVALSRAIKEQPELVARIAGELKGWDNRSIADELEVLRRAVEGHEGPQGGQAKTQARTKGQGGRTKTTFHIGSRAGQVKCTASQGRLEIKVDRDFSAIDRARLERAIADLIDGLG